MSVDGVLAQTAPWMAGASVALLAQAAGLAEPMLPAAVGGLGLGAAMYLILTRTLPELQRAQQLDAAANRAALDAITLRFDEALRESRQEHAQWRRDDVELRHAHAQHLQQLALTISELTEHIRS